MHGKKIMYSCFACGSTFQFGPHIYDGKHIRKYEITVCSGCYEGNWDGWAPHYEEKILKHLNEKELPVPNRNEAGYLPRG